MYRKADRKSESSRKLLKEDNSVNETDEFVGEEPLESVQIFPDFPLEDNAHHSIASSVQHVEGIMDPLPIYTQVPMDSPKENDESNNCLEGMCINCITHASYSSNFTSAFSPFSSLVFN